MSERDPNLVISGLSKTVTHDGITIEVHIVRLEADTNWTLEVVNEKGTSTVWDDPFPTDDAAYREFLRTVDEEGMTTFLDSVTVIPLKR